MGKAAILENAELGLERLSKKTPNPRFLIIGNGLIGSALTNDFPNSWTYSRTPSDSVGKIDITNPDSIRKVIRNFPGKAVINTAAYTNVDGAQKNVEEAFLINFLGAGNVAMVCQEERKQLAHLSTNLVLPDDPGNPNPHTEDEKTNPQSLYLGEYAKSKLLGEIAVRKIMADSTIVRITYPTTFSGGWFPTVLEYIYLGYKLHKNQFLSTTIQPELSAAIEVAATKKIRGILHVGSKNSTTPSEYANFIVSKFEIPESIQEDELSIPDDFSKISPRSLNGAINSYFTSEILGMKFMTWQEQIFFLAPYFKKQINKLRSLRQ